MCGVRPGLVEALGEVDVRKLVLAPRRHLRIEVVVHCQPPVDPQLGTLAVLQVEQKRPRRGSASRN